MKSSKQCFIWIFSLNTQDLFQNNQYLNTDYAISNHMKFFKKRSDSFLNRLLGVWYRSKETLIVSWYFTQNKSDVSLYVKTVLTKVNT